mgnify:CR=1 FL=1
MKTLLSFLILFLLIASSCSKNQRKVKRIDGKWNVVDATIQGFGNADPDVMCDLTDFLARIAPEEADYAHDTEGPDDMPAHLKTALTQTHLSIPIIGGRLGLGTWQGIWLLEHRAMAHQRSVILHFIGE